MPVKKVLLAFSATAMAMLVLPSSADALVKIENSTQIFGDTTAVPDSLGGAPVIFGDLAETTDVLLTRYPRVLIGAAGQSTVNAADTHPDGLVSRAALGVAASGGTTV